ncbi:MAG: type I restriction enzyme HsdR N-terminal domain-containing protein [Nannocystis sp.]|nr:type I restriction enzyme HsdR N-terminal domain-containing protein [Nannocystis sp.]
MADFAKKRSGGPAEKVDYAIRLAGAPVIFVECKAADVELSSHGGQLARYFNSTPSCPVAILTNGVRYQFFTDLEEKNILSARPFFEFNVLSFATAETELLEAFTRDRFDPSCVREQAEEIIYTSKISGYISSMLRNPPESLTRFVLGELGVFAGRKVTAKVIEKFTPTIRRAIQAALLDMATRSIKEQSAPAAPEVAAPADSKEKGAERGGVKSAEKDAEKDAEKKAERGSNVVTTPEELEALGDHPDDLRGLCGERDRAGDLEGYSELVHHLGCVDPAVVRPALLQSAPTLDLDDGLARPDEGALSRL